MKSKKYDNTSDDISKWTNKKLKLHAISHNVELTYLGWSKYDQASLDSILIELRSRGIDFDPDKNIHRIIHI